MCEYCTHVSKFNIADTLIVTRSGKTGLIHTFCVSRNTYLKYSMRCPSLVVQYNHARCIILIVYSYIASIL